MSSFRVFGFITALVVAAAAMPGASLAQGAAGPYVSVNAGVLVPRDIDFNVAGISGSIEFDPNVFLSGAAGYRFGNGIRLEAELAYGRASVKSVSALGVSVSANADVDIVFGTVNAFYDISTGTIVTPYLGGGLGFAYQNGSGDLSGSETDFTAFGEVGAAIRVANKVEIVPSYRYLYIDNGGAGFDNFTAHVFKIGARFGF